MLTLMAYALCVVGLVYVLRLLWAYSGIVADMKKKQRNEKRKFTCDNFHGLHFSLCRARYVDDDGRILTTDVNAIYCPLCQRIVAKEDDGYKYANIKERYVNEKCILTWTVIVDECGSLRRYEKK